MNNKVKDAFSEISAEETLKQKTLRAIKERGGRKKTRSLGRMLGWAASAACVAALLLAGGVLYTTQTAYISIDVNPSIELSLNRFDRVLKAVPKNEDARRVLSGIDLDHLKYSDALQKIVEAERALGYLHEGAAMVFAVQSDDAGQQGALIQESEAYAGNTVGAEQTTCYAVDGQELEEAHHHGISAGKYMAIQELREYDPTVTVDDYAHHSMREIHQEICHHQTGQEADPGTDHGGEHGSSEKNHDEERGSEDHDDNSHGHGSHGGDGEDVREPE